MPGGYFTGIGGTTRNSLAAFDVSSADPASWSLTNWDPDADDEVTSLALSGDGNTLYVGGWFWNINVGTGNESRDRLAAIDLTAGNTGDVTAWDPDVDDGFGNDYINTLLLSGNTLYVGGAFTRINAATDNDTRNNLAAIDLTAGDTNNVTTWDPNAGIASGTPDVQSLALSGDGSTLYVGGRFTTMGAAADTRNYIAALNTSGTTDVHTSWDPNAGNQIYSLLQSGTTLYAGGIFNSIGGQVQGYFAVLPPLSAPTITGTTPTSDSTPTWSWITRGGGNGTFRYKLDNSDLTSGATETTGTSYTPATALADGSYTLYVQERDDVGNWSATNSKTIVINATTPVDGGGGSCFIATAAYGSIFEPHVVILRQFRDDYLLTNAPGRYFVKLYYRTSPPIADYIRERETLRAATRFALIPVVYGVKYPGWLLVAVCLLLVGGFCRKVNKAPKVINNREDTGFAGGLY